MRNDYNYLFVPVRMPSGRAAVAYVDLVQTDVQRREGATRIAKQRAKLRRARLAERGFVLALASIIAITVLPVLLAAGVSVIAGALWRHSMQGRGTAANPGADRRYSWVRGRSFPSKAETLSMDVRTPGQPELPVKGALHYEVHEAIRRHRRRRVQRRCRSTASTH